LSLGLGVFSIIEIQGQGFGSNWLLKFMVIIKVNIHVKIQLQTLGQELGSGYIVTVMLKN
jgi:hypothetical protein